MFKIEAALLIAKENPRKYEIIDCNSIRYTNHLQLSHMLVLLMELMKENLTRPHLINNRDTTLAILKCLPHDKLVLLAPGLISKMTKQLMTFKDKSILYPCLEFVILSTLNDLESIKVAEYLQYLPLEMNIESLLRVVCKSENEAMIKSIANAFLYTIYTIQLNNMAIILPLLLPKMHNNIILVINLHYLKLIENYSLLLSLVTSDEYVLHILAIVPLDVIYQYSAIDSTIIGYFISHLPIEHFSLLKTDIYWRSLMVKSPHFATDTLLWDALNKNHIEALTQLSNNCKIPLSQIITSNFDYIADKAYLLLPNTDAMQVLGHSLTLMVNCDVHFIALQMEDTFLKCFDLLQTFPKNDMIEQIGKLLYRYTLMLQRNKQELPKIKKVTFQNLHEWLAIRLNKPPKQQKEGLNDTDDLHVLLIYKIAMHFISFSKINIRAIYMSIIYNCLDLCHSNKMYLNCIHLIWDQLLERLEDEPEVCFFVLKIFTKIAYLATDFLSSRFQSIYDKLERLLCYYLRYEKSNKLVEAAVECFESFILNCNLKTLQLRQLRLLNHPVLTTAVDNVLPEEAYLITKILKL